MKMDYSEAKSWVFTEARSLSAQLERTGANISATRPVLFETGYGPSGLPHIGTFGEVVRTSMIKHAFECLTGLPTRLVCLSDDMDGLRKVPDNVPEQEMMSKHLGKALTSVPDPFGQYPSFGAHNNARLQRFLDDFGFKYDFLSATECYRSGLFDAALMRVLECYDGIKEIILPTLGEVRRATYSPFMPVCPETNEVLQAEVVGQDVEKGEIEFIDPRDGIVKTTKVTGGHCKLQWKCDWAMRWYALGVDYEMSGKDLSESVVLSSKITRLMGGIPPQGFSYELFLDQNGEKISKSKGNGLSVEEWLTYGTAESLSLFMYHQPKRAKRLFFDVVPKTVDEYLTHLEKFPNLDAAKKVDSPIWHIHQGNPPQVEMPVSFSLLLNLASVCQAERGDIIWSYLQKYIDDISPESHPELDKLVSYAVLYYQERVRPFKTYRLPNANEVIHLTALQEKLKKIDKDASADEIQSAVFAVGKDANYANLREWFLCLYQTLLGQDEGPRMGSFIKLYGIAETEALIASALAGKLQG